MPGHILNHQPPLMPASIFRRFNYQPFHKIRLSLQSLRPSLDSSNQLLGSSGPLAGWLAGEEEGLTRRDHQLDVRTPHVLCSPSYGGSLCVT